MRRWCVLCFEKINACKKREKPRARWRDEKSNAERRDVCSHNARVLLKTTISSRMSQKTHLHVVVVDDSHYYVVFLRVFSFLAHATRSAESVERMKNFRSRASLFPHGTALLRDSFPYEYERN